MYVEKKDTSNDVVLRHVVREDLPIFFRQQMDPDANWMAAFTRRDPADESAFNEHWAKILNDPAIIIMTILYQARVAGYVLSFVMFGEREVGYWLGRDYWGKGIATRALVEFLTHLKERPLFAHTAKDNKASIRVLQKCGFSISGEGKGFARARGEEIEEYIFTLT